MTLPGLDSWAAASKEGIGKECRAAGRTENQEGRSIHSKPFKDEGFVSTYCGKMGGEEQLHPSHSPPKKWALPTVEILLSSLYYKTRSIRCLDLLF